MSAAGGAAAGAFKVNSLTGLDQASAVEGEVVWDAPRSLWNGFMLVGALIAGPLTFAWDAFLIFLATSAVTLCAGHSVGFHRRLIHRSFECPLWLDYLMMWLGTAVGIGGPIWTIRLHDSRDWAQRQPDCHWFLRHAKPLAIDGFYYLHFRLRLDRPPGFDPGPGIADDPFYRFLDRTWMLHQLPIAGCSGSAAAGRGWSGACSSGSRPARRCTGSSLISRTRADRATGPSTAP
jgi:sn-1 stearoyl-lipid 9-desaturase